MAQKALEYSATGRRKTSVARVRLVQGEGRMLVNGRELKDYFPLETLQSVVKQPLQVTDRATQYDVLANCSGGGLSGQAGALRHGISRALSMADQSLRPILKTHGFLTRDPRMKERLKPGQPGARKRFQFSKR